jgi:hypothetical protein
MKLHNLITPGFFGLVLVFTISPTIAKPNNKVCKLENSTYSAIASPDWTIEVTKAQEPAANESVGFRLKHKIRGEIGHYNLGQSNGYGSFYLRDLEQLLDEKNAPLQPVLFDRSWQSIRTLDAFPQYLFIPNLGSTDWYGDQPQNREMPLGEVMWEFSACRKS